MEEITRRLKQNGVVGAGGAGFPTYAKLKPPIDTLIINGAECEPLLHKDKELLKKHGETILQGMARMRDFVQAKEAVLGIKDKYTDTINLLTPLLPQGVRMHPLGDFYPAGDEFVLVYEVTGNVIPRGGLPIHVGALVMNVETVLNFMLERPVTHKHLTVAGAVNDPKTARVPLGTSFQDVIEACGGASVQDFEVLSGGVMMGRLATDLRVPVTKTTGGLIVFPSDHPLIRKYSRDATEINRIGKSACDQCSFCTELCPRYLLGHPIQPHLAMRSLVFSQEHESFILGAQFCCECNLCTMIACPEDLDPKNVCVMNKQELREHNLSYPEDVEDRPVHGMLEGRRTPLTRLFKKLGLNEFVNKGPFVDVNFSPERVTLPLKQHVGAPAKPIVQEGNRVNKGQMIAECSEEDLGVCIHASIDGTINRITDSEIEIQKG